MCILDCSLLVLVLVLTLGSKSVVLFSDLIDLSHVLEEIRASLQSDEQFGLFAVSVASGTLYRDGSSSDLLESGIVVSRIIQINGGN